MQGQGYDVPLRQEHEWLQLVWVQGRHVLWGWLQERRKAGSYNYSGCMTVPRLLYLEDERLIQVTPIVGTVYKAHFPPYLFTWLVSLHASFILLYALML